MSCRIHYGSNGRVTAQSPDPQRLRKISSELKCQHSFFRFVPSRRRASQQTFRNNGRNHLDDRKEMNRLARQNGRSRLFETAMVTGIALACGNKAKLGAAWGERALPPIKSYASLQQ